MTDKLSINFDKFKNKFRLRIRMKNGGNKHIGYFDNEKDALDYGNEIIKGE